MIRPSNSYARDVTLRLDVTQLLGVGRLVLQLDGGCGVSANNLVLVGCQYSG